jgi:DNA-binding GntR family transcriptional regulator
MAETPVEPFQAALAYLRERLQTGALAPGARLTAVELADELRLSTTPVREALSRLAGEGLVEDRRGQGYFVRVLSADDIADLYRMSLAHLLIALEPRRARRPLAHDVPIANPAGDGEAVEAVEALFHRWVAAGGGRLLVRSFRVLQIQLGPARRVEAGLVADLPAEAAKILALEPDGARGERLAALRQFHGRRIREADRFAGRLEAAAQSPRK